MPESPEVQVLVEELGERLTGRALASVDVVEFRTTKTRARPPESLVGEGVTATARHGKLVDLSFGAQHLVVSLGRHGWARWAGSGAEADPVEDPPPALVVLEFDDGSILELTDAGDWVSLGCWVVDDPRRCRPWRSSDPTRPTRGSRERTSTVPSWAVASR